MTMDLLLLREWCERLCRLPATDPPLVVAALGITGCARPGLRGVATIDPPPSGTTRCEVGVVRGRFCYLRLIFATPVMARRMFEDAMGPGVPLRRLGHDPARSVAYRVVLDQAPFSCDLLASFAEAPTENSLVTGVTLRRERGVTGLAHRTPPPVR
jgi:hypothetical protein